MKSVCGKCKHNPCECEENAAIEKLFKSKPLDEQIDDALHMSTYQMRKLAIQRLVHDAYNAAIHDAASLTNSGMHNYQKIMGLLRK